MTQSKTIMETVEIPLDQIKPSPYQPRLTFNLENIKGSIQRDGILVPLTVRKKDGYYELIDGERRVRLAEELGYETVPVTVIDVDDETARRMVWKVNTLRQDYSPKEKAYYFLKLQKPLYGMSLQGIARECDIGVKDVKAYLNVLKLPKEYQQMVWDRVIPIRNIRELGQLFNGVARATPEENPEIFELLDRSAGEKHFGAEQIREAIRPYLAKLREEQIAKAKEVIEEIEPEVKAPTTPEELEEAAKALRKKAKELKSPKQILEEKREKARESLLTGGRSSLSKIEKAKKLGIDTVEFEERLEEIKMKIVDNPDGALKESKKLKRDIGNVIKDFEEKKKEAKIKEKAMKEAREKIEKELLEDEKFRRKAVEKHRVEEAKKVVGEIAGKIVLSPEDKAQFKESMQEYQESLEKLLSNPVVQKRGKFFRNWFGHSKIIGFTNLISCPKCGNTELSWKCEDHSITLEEARDMLQKEYEETYKEKL